MRIRKVYNKGCILVSATLGVAYFIFKNEMIGEMCMICLRHKVYKVKVMECRVGLAVHRCLILREKLNNDQLKGLLQER